jgi:hypothetical protein
MKYLALKLKICLRQLKMLGIRNYFKLVLTNEDIFRDVSTETLLRETIKKVKRESLIQINSKVMMVL